MPIGAGAGADHVNRKPRPGVCIVMINQIVSCFRLFCGRTGKIEPIDMNEYLNLHAYHYVIEHDHVVVR